MMARVVLLRPSGTGLPSHHPILAVCAVLLGPFIVGFHSRLFGIGLVDLRAAFGLSVDESAWLNTLSTAPQILVAPCIAWLASTFGVRRVMVVPAFAYAILSYIIPLVSNFELLALLHLLHGALLGVFVPATLLIIFRNLPVKWWITAVGVYAFRSAFTTNAGTALLDFYIQHIGWQYLYWQDVALAPIMAILAMFGAPHERIDRDLVHSADWGGMLLLGSGLALVFAGIDQGNRLDWFESGFVTCCIVGGGVLLVTFVINEAVITKPWASLATIGVPNIALTLTIALFYLLTALSNTLLIPNYLTTVAGLRPEQIGGVLLTWSCIPLVIMTPLVVWGLHKIDGRWLILTGLACFAMASLLGTGLTSEWDGDNFRVICVLQGVGHILCFLPVIIMVVANASPQKATALAAYIQVIRLLGSEIAQSLLTTFLRKREQAQSYLLGLNIDRGGQETSQALATLAHRVAGASPSLSQLRATSLLGQEVQRQANVLSYIDGFWLTFAAAIAGLVILAFVTKAPRGPLIAN